MSKKNYEKPSMKVVELQYQKHLLQISGQLNNPVNYPNGGDPFSAPALDNVPLGLLDF